MIMRNPPPAEPFRLLGHLFSAGTVALLIGTAVACSSADGGDRLSTQAVGPADGGMIVPTGQLVRPAGETRTFFGRPTDIALSPAGTLVFVKLTSELMIVDAQSWKIVRDLPYPIEDEGSMHGLAVSKDGQRVYVTGSTRYLLEARCNGRGDWNWQPPIALAKGKLHSAGIALSRGERTAFVCASIANCLAVVDLKAGAIQAKVPTGVCPFDVVLTPDGRTAYVSNFGGRPPHEGEHAESSVGTPVAVDDRSISISGTVTRVDLKALKATGELEVGLHPSDLELSADGARLFVANSNSDTVSVIDTAAWKVQETINVRPDDKLPFGSISNALALSPDRRTLLVANGGNNAVAVVALATAAGRPSKVRGFIPTGWFPGGLCTDGKQIYIANVKGEGSHLAQEKRASWNSRAVRGSISRVEAPDDATLARYTAQVVADGRVPQMLRALEAGRSGMPAVAVPSRPGEPSVLEHVVYVIKENRSYDQVFGDLPRGNNDPRLCTFGRAITPNHHALAEQFVLLDNYYCNGVVSADGHQWATQGAVTDYREKTTGGYTRSYEFGTDALCYAGCNFIWDSALLAGRSFRNYGEFDMPTVVPKANWFDVYNDFSAGKGKITFRQSIPTETLRKYTCPTYPGWNLGIPDALRLDAFLKEFHEYEKSGQWQNLVIVYLPQDHTAGTRHDVPTPRAFVADNDQAVGRLVEAISHSRFWPKTAIFINEDDPQAGWDHVDGHRSLCLVISPYAKRRAVVSQFYNQCSVLHTIERILDLPTTSQLVAQSPLMTACFLEKPDLTPYQARPAGVRIDERNAAIGTLQGKARELAEASERFDLREPDRIDDDTMNRILWHSCMGIGRAYPAEFAGAHGKGLKQLGLKLDAVERD
jgi:YVTN family beta-propeller protein